MCLSYKRRKGGKIRLGFHFPPFHLLLHRFPFVLHLFLLFRFVIAQMSILFTRTYYVSFRLALSLLTYHSLQPSPVQASQSEMKNILFQFIEENQEWKRFVCDLHNSMIERYKVCQKTSLNVCQLYIFLTYTMCRAWLQFLTMM